MRACLNCGKEFYAPQWVLRDTERRSGTYCSRACKHQMQGMFLSHQRGPDLIEHSAGYLLAWAPEHPRAQRGRVFQHILVAEQILGRYLESGEQVHHRDRNPQNNDPSNLEVLLAGEHTRRHVEQGDLNTRRRRVTLNCAECGTAFEVKTSRATSLDPRSRTLYCSRPCRSKAWKRQMDARRANPSRDVLLRRLVRAKVQAERKVAKLQAKLADLESQ
jgi:hypothetical protein